MAIAIATATPEPMALRVRGLSKRYEGAVSPVWSGISFDVPHGQRLAIIGGNGAGKSTLLRCCMRLIEPNAGQVLLDGLELTQLRGAALAKARARVGFVFQKHNLVGRLSVLTNVLHGGMARASSPRMWFQGLASAEDRDYAMHCLEQVNLAHLCKRRADELSGGQSQRVAIARALMQKPRMIFADEPVASLDPQAGEDVMQVFSDLAQQQGMTLVFVTHHLDHALNYADRVIGLQQGNLQLDSAAIRLNAHQLRGMYAEAAA
ncbi:phosphonate ABC transporter ATP-binding protein [Pseudomonas sp. TTU2014-080ASC]|jgi:phosphonate transport system ATP-binding protein|uniref:phosphonate ABC transporter ATP-binding protein n=1 Tax=Pseudomonas sp. TTU2014-080ASC TaxID=1729724 RepID=UPI000718AA84|nr:ATP-binding cassette domain-containing protein [Pseudomonas sp. TTU2014-080ASC]KRW61000.1 ABC transporter [Pseudomonas sp. TTU2014-080ASC]